MSTEVEDDRDPESGAKRPSDPDDAAKDERDGDDEPGDDERDGDAQDDDEPGDDEPGDDEPGDDDDAEEGDAKAGAKAAQRKPAPVPLRPPSVAFLVIMTIINIVADQASKYWAIQRLENPPDPSQRAVVVIEDHLQFIFARNRGGAWGLLEDQPEMVRMPFFILLTAGAIVFIIWLYRRLHPKQHALRWGLPLVLGGAIGNLIDRVRFKYVVDFIDVFATIGGEVEHWPTFNVADISIVAGVILIGIDMFGQQPESAKAKKKGAKAGRKGNLKEPEASRS